MSNNWQIVLMSLVPFLLIFLWTLFNSWREDRRVKKEWEDYASNYSE